MGEKRYVACKDEYGVYLKTPEGDSVHTLSIIADLLNSQSAEIAGLRETVEGLRMKLVCAARLLEFAKDVAHAFDSKKYENRINYTAFRSICIEASMFIPVDIPNHSEIPNSSEDTRTRNPGVPGREQMHKILKDRSEEIQRGEVSR